MKIPRINCKYYTYFGQCNHLEMGRGFLGLGKPCVMNHPFVRECCKRIRYKRTSPPTKPPADD